ncbi:hypothetical protein BCV69DRAFT_281025 [Microstroma glucosiphilum]|uniref:LIM zinc-binding domain-containing protein n=1 Tax=Pseudomicrostroma glucosiphilum TaxID=1684307 RepID=A0A316UER3_9BASI|nr:hypothetical protein BCV69DRAFT_281025 [Pseudomicrostroma glucosiphilum]PWN23408.1 hypothetical protein BCV69DRAFT_281025 [Pseudomicrostroma glucosiphilum]
MVYHLEAGPRPPLQTQRSLGALQQQQQQQQQPADAYLFSPHFDDLRAARFSRSYSYSQTTSPLLQPHKASSPLRRPEDPPSSAPYRNYHYDYRASPPGIGTDDFDDHAGPSGSRQVNVAGLGAGARRAMESGRREAEQAQRNREMDYQLQQQHHYQQQQQQQYEEEERRRAWEEEHFQRQAQEKERVAAEQEQQRQQQVRRQREEQMQRQAEEAERCRIRAEEEEVAAERARIVEQQRAQEWYRQHQERERQYEHEAHSSPAVPEAAVKEAAQEWYSAEDRGSSRPLTNGQYYARQSLTNADDEGEGESRDVLGDLPIQRTGKKGQRSTAVEESSRDSCSSMASQAYLAYDQPSPPEHPTDGTPVFHGLSIKDDTVQRRSKFDSLQAFSIAGTNVDYQRETVYEDDFEEEALGNLSRYTHYGGGQDSIPSHGGSAWSGARKSLFRATTYQPVPMARCADCKQELDLEELASHLCDRTSAGSTPTATASPRSPLSPLVIPEPGAITTMSPSTSLSPSSSRFMERYNAMEATPRKKSLFNTAHSHSPKAASTDSSMHSPRALQVTKEEIVRSSSSPAASPLSSSLTAFEAGVATEKRRQIESQRAAKQALSPRPSDSIDGFSSFLQPSSPTSSSSSRPSPSRSQSDTVANGQRPSAAVDNSRLRPVLTQQERSNSDRIVSCTSTSSSASSSGAGSSLFAPNSPAVAITPSSSFGDSVDLESSKDSDRARGGGSSPGFLSPEMATAAGAAAAAAAATWGRPMLPERKTSRKKGALPAPLDLGEVERMMRDLKADVAAVGSVSQPSSAEVPVRRGAASSHKQGNSPGSNKSNLNRPPRSSSSSASSRHKTNGNGDSLALSITSSCASASSISSSSGSSSSTTAATAARRGARRAARKCCVCSCSLSQPRPGSSAASEKIKFVEKDGRYFCAEDYRQRYLPKCAYCRLTVEKGGVKSSDGALRGIYHRDCFRCSTPTCRARFEQGEFFVWEGAPYCFEDYSKKAGTICGECQRGIMGECRQVLPPIVGAAAVGAGHSPASSHDVDLATGVETPAAATGARFHPSCFTCQYLYHPNSLGTGTKPDNHDHGRQGQRRQQQGRCSVQLDDFWETHDGRRVCEEHALLLLREEEEEREEREQQQQRGGGGGGAAAAAWQDGGGGGGGGWGLSVEAGKGGGGGGGKRRGPLAGASLRAQKRGTMLKALV